ncbi:MAG TPA: putative sulfate exporter family transporter [Chloroflexia bacterium]|nr:putative sulfate exporter family transporter [Chloroflexia bacterium]
MALPERVSDLEEKVEPALRVVEEPVKQSFDVRPNKPKWRNFSLGVGLTALIGLAATLLAPLPGLAAMGSLTVALLLGIGWRSGLGLERAYAGGVQFSAKKLLRYGIILTGVRLNFGLVASSGLQVLLLDLLMITFGLCCIPWLGRKLGLSKGLALLLGVGQSICGASAVGAIAPLSPDVNEDDVSLAVAICGLIGTVGVLFYVFAGQLFHMQANFYGLTSGSTLHEIAQVVAAGPAGGQNAADLAMVVKLTRVMLLAPVALLLAFLFTMKAEKKAEKAAGAKRLGWKQVPIPWFVFGFLAVGVINSLGWLSKDLSNLILQASVFLMVMAMAGMGLQVDLAVVRRMGLKALGVGLLAFALFVTVGFTLTFILTGF